MIYVAADDTHRGHHHVDPGHAVHDFDVDEDACESVTSDEPYSSSDGGAPDLEVEASPPQRDGGAGRPTENGVDSSFFSDYEAEMHSKASVEASLQPPPPLKQSPYAKRTMEASAAAPLDEEEGDAFYDADFESRADQRRRASSPSPVPSAVVYWEHDGVASPSPHPDRDSHAWLDSLRELSSPPVDVKEEEAGEQVGRSSQEPHGLSSSPLRGADPSQSKPHSDTPFSYPGPPSVALREGTAPPSQGTRTQRPSTSMEQPAKASAPRSFRESLPAAQDTTHEESSSMNVETKPYTAQSAGVDGARGSSLLQVRQPNDTGNVLSAANSSFLKPTPPPKPAAAPPQGTFGRPGGTIVQARIPGLHALPTSVVTPDSAVQQRVVRGRAPRGVPLLMQCTGHASTPTRTIVVDPSAVSEDEEDGETVNAGLHTSAYRETSGMSDILSSPSRQSPDARATACIHGEAVPPPATPERAGERRRRRRHRRSAKRSASPFVSFVENGNGSTAEDVSMPFHNGALRRSRHSPVSSSSPSSSSEILSAPPELVNFSIHTEDAVERETDDSLVLCSYSVESFPLSAGAGATWAKRHEDNDLQTAQPPREAQRNAAVSHAYQRRDVTEGGRQPPPSLMSAPSPAAVSESMKESAAYPWPSRELFQSAQASRFSGFPNERRERELHSRPDGASLVIDSVEETSMEDDVGADGLRQRLAERRVAYENEVCSVDSHASIFAPGGNVGQSAGTVNVSNVSGHALPDENHSEQLRQRRQQREAVRALLARQTDPRRASNSRTRCDQVREASLSQPPPAAAYVAKQEQRRRERLAAEAERLRLGLACDVCQTVRPHGRDLLLMFLLLVEESNTTQQRRWQSSMRRHGNGSGFAADDSQCPESRVSYETCAEAVNCVLERHGVSWARATRELCRRVVAWCRGERRESGLLDDARAEPRDDSLVEYTTFVSSVMEFAEHYPRGSS